VDNSPIGENSPNLVTLKEMKFHLSTWDRCYDFKNIFAKKIGEKLCFFIEPLLVFAKNGFSEKHQFFRRKLLSKHRPQKN
jgi:hypothetical protein